MDLEKINSTTWYRGQSDRTHELDYNYVGKGNDQEGPGFYFTDTKEDAGRYGQIIQGSVRLRKLASNKKPVNPETIRQLILMAPKVETTLLDWAENPSAGLKFAVEAAIQQGSEKDSFQQIWYDFYLQEPAQYLKNLVQLGYDGHLATWTKGVQHLILYNPDAFRPGESVTATDESEEYLSYDIDWAELAQNIQEWVDQADTETFLYFKHISKNLPEDLRVCDDTLYRGHSGTTEGYEKLMGGSKLKVKAGSWSLQDTEAAKFALGGNAYGDNSFKAVLQINPKPNQVLLNLQEAITHPMLQAKLDDWTIQRIQDEGEVLLDEVTITKENIVPLKELAQEIGLDDHYEKLFEAGRVSADIVTDSPAEQWGRWDFNVTDRLKEINSTPVKSISDIEPEALNWLLEYIYGERIEELKVSMTPKIIEALKPYRLKKSRRLYRGQYAYDFETVAEEFNNVFPTEGDPYVLKRGPTSWTYDFNMAKDSFTDGCEGFGYVLEHTFRPEDSVFDYMALSEEDKEFIEQQIKELFGVDRTSHEAEVLIKKGHYETKIIFICDNEGKRQHATAKKSSPKYPSEDDFEDAWAIVRFVFGMEDGDDYDQTAFEELYTNWMEALNQAKLERWTVQEAAKHFAVYDHGRRLKGKKLQNPIIVAKIGNYYTVLDGSHRLITKFENNEEFIDALIVPMPWADELSGMDSSTLAKIGQATEFKFKWKKENHEDGFEIIVTDARTGDYVGNVSVAREFIDESDPWFFEIYKDEPFYEDMIQTDYITDLRTLSVERDYQRQGVAKHIFNLALKEIKKQYPDDPIFLNASPLGGDIRLVDLIEFYKKAGFKVLKKYSEHDNATLWMDSPAKLRAVAATKTDAESVIRKLRKILPASVKIELVGSLAKNKTGKDIDIKLQINPDKLTDEDYESEEPFWWKPLEQAGFRPIDLEAVYDTADGGQIGMETWEHGNLTVDLFPDWGVESSVTAIRKTKKYADEYPVYQFETEVINDIQHTRKGSAAELEELGQYRSGHGYTFLPARAELYLERYGVPDWIYSISSIYPERGTIHAVYVQKGRDLIQIWNYGNIRGEFPWKAFEAQANQKGLSVKRMHRGMIEDSHGYWLDDPEYLGKAEKTESGIEDTDYPYYHTSDHPDTPSVPKDLISKEGGRRGKLEPHGIFLFIKGEQVGTEGFNKRKYRWDAKLKPGTKVYPVYNLPDEVKDYIDFDKFIQHDRSSAEDYYGAITDFVSWCKGHGEPVEKGNFFEWLEETGEDWRALVLSVANPKELTEILKKAGVQAILDEQGYYFFFGEPQLMVIDTSIIEWGPREENVTDKEVYRLSGKTKVTSDVIDSFMEKTLDTINDPSFLEFFTTSFPPQTKWAQEGGLKESVEEFRARFEASAQYRGNRLLVIRCIAVDDVDQFIKQPPRNVGVFWSFSEEGADCYWGDKSKDQIHVFGLVNLKDIDWKTTVAYNCQMWGNQEDEIRLLPDAKVEVTEYLTLRGDNADQDNIVPEKKTVVRAKTSSQTLQNMTWDKFLAYWSMSEILEKDNAWDCFENKEDPEAIKHYRKVFEARKAELLNLTWPIKVYRGLPKISDHRHMGDNQFGVHWSVDPKLAQGFAGRSGGTVWETEVTPDQIEWYHTLLTRMPSDFHEQENELTLESGQEIEIKPYSGEGKTKRVTTTRKTKPYQDEYPVYEFEKEVSSDIQISDKGSEWRLKEMGQYRSGHAYGYLPMRAELYLERYGVPDWIYSIVSIYPKRGTIHAVYVQKGKDLIKLWDRGNTLSEYPWKTFEAQAHAKGYRIKGMYKGVIEDANGYWLNDPEFKKPVTSESFEDEGFVGDYWGSHGSGIMFLHQNKILLLKRASWVEQPGTWGIPGGAIPVDESGKPMDAFKSAMNEAQEEIGDPHTFKQFDKVVYRDGDFTYTTFLAESTTEFTPTLNDESVDYVWADLNDLPKPLHFGVQYVLDNSDLLKRKPITAKSNPLLEGEMDFTDWLEYHDPIAEGVFQTEDQAKAFFQHRSKIIHDWARRIGSGALLLYRALGFKTVQERDQFLKNLKAKKYADGFKGLGIFWSMFSSGADTYEGPSQQKATLVARVPQSSVDWETTYSRLLDPFYANEEEEVRLLLGKPLEIVSVTDQTGKVLWKPEKAHRMKSGFYFWEPGADLYTDTPQTDWQQDQRTMPQEPTADWPSVRLVNKKEEPTPEVLRRYVMGEDSIPDLKDLKEYQTKILPKLKKLYPSGNINLYRGFSSYETPGELGEIFTDPKALVSFTESKATAIAIAKERAAVIRGGKVKALIPVETSRTEANQANWPQKMNNLQLARHWEQMAYGDWGPISDAEVEEALERVEHLYESNTIWTLQTLKVQDIEGHHSGHDASEEYIEEYQVRKQQGSDFPPIIVEPDEDHPGKYKTIDGQHRLFAAKKLGEQTIRAYVPDGGVTSGYKSHQGIFKELNKKYPELEDLYGEEAQDFIWLSRMVVPADLQGKGIGTSLMLDLIAYAEKTNKKIYLSPAELTDETNPEKLLKFYKNFGFIENDPKTAHRNFGFETLMYVPTGYGKVAAKTSQPMVADSDAQRTTAYLKELNEMFAQEMRNPSVQRSILDDTQNWWGIDEDLSLEQKKEFILDRAFGEDYPEWMMDLESRGEVGTDYIILYRGVSADSPEHIDFSKLGIYWTWDQAKAANYSDTNTDKFLHIIKAKVPFGSIDFGKTLRKAVWRGYSLDESEREFELKRGKPVDVLEILKPGDVTEEGPGKAIASEHTTAEKVFEANESEPFRYVWRVENHEGKGPYREDSGWVDADHYTSPNRPMPGSDKFTPEDLDIMHELSKAGEILFGFESLEGLKKWFSRHELQKLKERGYGIVKRKAMEIWSSGRQVFFKPYGTDRQKVSAGAKGYWEAEGYELNFISEDEDGIFLIQALHPDGYEVGRLEFTYSEADSSKLYPINVEVDSAHQRKGLASAMYRLAEDEMGMQFKHGSQSPEGTKFRKAYDKRTVSKTESEFKKIAQWYLDKVFKCPDMPMPEFKVVNRLDNTLGRARMEYDWAVPIVELHQSIIDNPESLDRVIAHELIHVWQFTCVPEVQEYFQIARESGGRVTRDVAARLKRMLNEYAGHSTNFHEWADRINKIKGPDYVTEKSDETLKTAKNTKPFFIFLEEWNDGRIAYGVFVKPSPQIKKEMKRRSENHQTKLFRITDERFLQSTRLGPYGKGRFIPKDPEAIKILKDLWKKGEVVTASTDLTVYHGSKQKIDNFKIGIPSKRFLFFKEFEVKSQGAFFAFSPESAKEFGPHCHAVTLDSVNLFIDIKDATAGVDRITSEKEQQLDQMLRAISNTEINLYLKDIKVPPPGSDLDWVYEAIESGGLLWDLLDVEAFVTKLKELGYDGTCVREDDVKEKRSLFICNLAKIKSVTDCNESITATIEITPNDVNFKPETEETIKGLTFSFGTGEHPTVENDFPNFAFIKKDNQTLAHIMYETTASNALYIRSMFTKPSERRKGLMKKLIEWLKKKEGISKLDYNTLTDEGAAFWPSVAVTAGRFKELAIEQQELMEKQMTGAVSPDGSTATLYRTVSTYLFNEIDPLYPGSGVFGEGTYFALTPKETEPYMSPEASDWNWLFRYEFNFDKPLMINSPQDIDLKHGGTTETINTDELQDQIGLDTLDTNELGDLAREYGFDAVIMQGQVDGGPQVLVPAKTKPSYRISGVSFITRDPDLMDDVVEATGAQYVQFNSFGDVIFKSLNPNQIESIDGLLEHYENIRLGNEVTSSQREMILAAPELKTLKDNKKKLTDEERQQVLDAGAVWHRGPSGKEAAIWKATVRGKDWYCCNTHRAYRVSPTLKGAIKDFDFIKTTAATEVESNLQFKSTPTLWNNRVKIDKGVTDRDKVYLATKGLKDFILQYLNVPDQELMEQIQAANSDQEIPEEFFRRNPDLIYFDGLNFTAYRLSQYLQPTILKVLLAIRSGSTLPEKFRIRLFSPVRDKEYLVKDLLQKGEKLIESATLEPVKNPRRIES